MKKINYALCAMFVALVLASCGGGAKKPAGESEQAATGETDLKRDNLQGKVKSVRQRVYWALEKFGRMEKGKLQNLRGQDYLRLYNEQGFLVEETFYDSRDTVVSSRKISYTDKVGQIAKEESFTGGKLSSTTVYTYADDRLTKKEIHDGEGKLKEGFNYSYYKDSGLLMDEDKLNSAGKLVQKIVHVYDNIGALIEKQYYWGGGSPYKKEQFVYSNGSLTQVLSWKYENKEEKADGYVEYSDYDNGKYSRKTVYDANGAEVERTSHSTDTYGNLVYDLTSKNEPQEELNFAGDSTFVADTSNAGATSDNSDTTVNDQGEMSDDASDEPVWGPPTGYLYQYEYDAQHNWTRKITYKAAPNDKHEKALALDDDIENVRQFYYDRVIVYY